MDSFDGRGADCSVVVFLEIYLIDLEELKRIGALYARNPKWMIIVAQSLKPHMNSKNRAYVLFLQRNEHVCAHVR